uniref:Uncharacterized protein n=1 Tax=Tetranychus urticae TaxID=32264 RepID=T1KWV5_TETUR
MIVLRSNTSINYFHFKPVNSSTRRLLSFLTVESKHFHEMSSILNTYPKNG